MNIKNPLSKLLIAILAVFAFNLSAQANNYEITITNLTKTQSFTPILAAVHRRAADVFEVGQAASAGLEAIAEEGDISGLQATLDGLDTVGATAASEGLLAAGASTTITIPAQGGNRISLVSMLIPTNDAFVGLDSVRAPRGRQTLTYFARVYDAGTEINDELCSSIPGPGFTECADGNNSVPQPTGDDVGFIHVHSGIHGVGDLVESTRDFNGPVARITITRTR